MPRTYNVPTRWQQCASWWHQPWKFRETRVPPFCLSTFNYAHAQVRVKFYAGKIINTGNVRRSYCSSKKCKSAMSREMTSSQHLQRSACVAQSSPARYGLKMYAAATQQESHGHETTPRRRMYAQCQYATEIRILPPENIEMFAATRKQEAAEIRRAYDNSQPPRRRRQKRTRQLRDEPTKLP